MDNTRKDRKESTSGTKFERSVEIGKKVVQEVTTQMEELYAVEMYNALYHKWKVIGTYKVDARGLIKLKAAVRNVFKKYKSKAITKIRARRLR